MPMSKLSHTLDIFSIKTFFGAGVAGVIKMNVEPNNSEENPVNSANWLSKLLLFWVWPFFSKGYNNNLTEKDIPRAPPEDRADENLNELLRNWEHHRALINPRHNIPEKEKLLRNGHHEHVELGSFRNYPSQQTAQNQGCSIIFKALLSTFGLQYFIIWPVMIIMDCFVRVLQPYFLLLLVRSFMEESTNSTNQYIFAAGVCISTLALTLVNNPCLLYILRIGMRSRIALTSLIQRKMMSMAIFGDRTDQGKLITLVQKDAGLLEQYIQFFPYLLIGPVQLLFFMYFLWDEFGISSLAGVCFVIVSLPLQYINGSQSTKFREAIGKKTEERTQLLSETVAGMNTIKMYTWEQTFATLIKNFRKSEVKELTKRSMLHAFYMSMFLTSSRLVPFLTFLAFVLGGGPLTADRVFYSIAAFNTITHFLGFFVLTAVRGTGEVVGSLKRIQEFLLKDDITPAKNKSDANPSITLNEARARWAKDKELTINDLNVSWRRNRLIIIVGSNGSGKSSLFQILLKELPLESGDCDIRGKISYASQVPWIFNATIKQNIIFTERFDNARYRKVIKAAGLETDLKQIRNGDNAMAGDKGSSLSGGQKARVNLARALYRDANIYLFDDPLSAVDTGVGKHLFEEIKSMEGCLRILVTHQHQHLQNADHIVFMKDGKIEGEGSYDELRSGNQLFNDFVQAQESSDVDSLTTTGKASLPGTQTSEEGNDSGNDEQQATGSMGFRVYWKYFKAASSPMQLTFYFLMFIISQLFATFIEYWLALWTDVEEEMYKQQQFSAKSLLTSNNTGSEIVFDSDNLINATETLPIESIDDFFANIENLDQHIYLKVYAGLTAAVFITNLVKSLGFFKYCMKICNNLHERMLSTLVRAQPKFFHTNSPGRIMNRFSRDIGIIDEAIPFSFFDMWTIFLQIGTVIFLIIVANWYTAFPILIFIVMLWFVRRYYVTTSRDLKRIEGKVKGPVINHIQATDDGIVTIRSCESGAQISSDFDSLQDIHSATQFMFLATTRCFDIWVETIATILLTLVTFSFLLSQNYLGTVFLGGKVGLAICSAMSLTNWLQYGMRTSADVENHMVSVERAVEYTKLKPEAELQSSPENKPPATWPENGRLEFCNVTLSYKDDSSQPQSGENDVLKGLNFNVNAGEKIGIVGRTGAGKSSVLWALFRMTELRMGQIFIDGRNVEQLGLHDLRKKMLIIPQDPVLFKGTLRFNLDSTGEVKDSDMCSVLQQVGLRKNLEDELTSGGNNFCVGERQLVSLARALLHNRKVMVMDEATSSVDPRADQAIQRNIREKFADCTVLTIAHKLDTVIDSDKILVLEEGKIKEYGAPHLLLQIPDGALRAFVNDSGQQRAELEEKAKQAYDRMTNKN